MVHGSISYSQGWHKPYTSLLVLPCLWLLTLSQSAVLLPQYLASYFGRLPDSQYSAVCLAIVVKCNIIQRKTFQSACLSSSYKGRSNLEPWIILCSAFSNYLGHTKLPTDVRVTFNKVTKQKSLQYYSFLLSSFLYYTN